MQAQPGFDNAGRSHEPLHDRTQAEAHRRFGVKRSGRTEARDPPVVA